MLDRAEAEAMLASMVLLKSSLRTALNEASLLNIPTVEDRLQQAWDALSSEITELAPPEFRKLG